MKDENKSREQLFDELRELRRKVAELEQSQMACRVIERDLYHSEELYRKLVETMSDGLILRDKNSLIVYANNSLCEMWGCSREELIGRRMEEFLDEDNRPVFDEQMVKRRKGIYEPYEITWTSRDGRKVVTHMAPKTVFDAAGNFQSSFAVVTDITARKAAEDALTQQTLELARSNAELEQFAYVSSHDLQEPLRKIQAFGNRLKTKCGDDLSDQGRDYLERMQNAAQRMQTLISDLLMFSRVTTKAQPFSEVDLNWVVRNAVSNLHMPIEQTKAKVTFGEMPTIEADPTQMHQLLQNLISNALKFHREGEAPVVKIYAKRIENPEGRPFGEFCQIIVEDNGIGFDEKYLDRIFGVFQRLHGRNVYEGTGIGLAVCQKIVDRHGGSITAQSTPGEGTLFIITLPVKQIEEGNAK